MGWGPAVAFGSAPAGAAQGNTSLKVPDGDLPRPPVKQRIIYPPQCFSKEMVGWWKTAPPLRSAHQGQDLMAVLMLSLQIPSISSSSPHSMVHESLRADSESFRRGPRFSLYHLLPRIAFYLLIGGMFGSSEVTLGHWLRTPSAPCWQNSHHKHQALELAEKTDLKMKSKRVK